MWLTRASARQRATLAIASAVLGAAATLAFAGQSLQAGATPAGSKPASPNQGVEQPPRVDPAGADELSFATYNVQGLGKLEEVACSISYNLRHPALVALQEAHSESRALSLIGLIRTFSDALPDGSAPDYTVAVAQSTKGSDKLALLYDREQLTLLTADEWPACTNEPLISIPNYCPFPGVSGRLKLSDRAPYFARFEVKTDGGRFNVVSNHWRSGDHARNRELEAAHVCLLVKRSLRTEPSVPVFVVGDLNSDAGSPPYQAAAGCDDLYDPYAQLPRESRKTSKTGAIDHILVQRRVSPTDLAVLQINVDAAEVPYDASDQQCRPGLALASASDHNPMLLRVRHADLLPSDGLMLPFVSREGPPAPTAIATPTALPLRIAALDCRGSRSDNADESVEIENRGGLAAELESWHLHSAVGDQTYRFPAGASIGAGESCVVFTNMTATPPTCSYSWEWRAGQGVWNNGGDQACLYDPSGRLVDCRSCDPDEPCEALCPTAPSRLPTDTPTPPASSTAE